MKNLKGICILFIIIVNTIMWFLPLVLFALVRVIVPGVFFRQLFTKLSSQMATLWISCNSFIFSRSNQTKWDIQGVEQLSKKDWYLLLVNHLSWVDVIVLQTVFNKEIPFL